MCNYGDIYDDDFYHCTISLRGVIFGWSYSISVMINHFIGWGPICPYDNLCNDCRCDQSVLLWFILYCGVVLMELEFRPFNLVFDMTDLYIIRFIEAGWGMVEGLFNVTIDIQWLLLIYMEILYIFPEHLPIQLWITVYLLRKTNPQSNRTSK